MLSVSLRTSSYSSRRRPPKVSSAVIKSSVHPQMFEILTCASGADIYLAQEKNLELFVQVGYDALDTGDGGISGETNPVRHREIAKKLAPAFSTRNLRAKEAAIQKHLEIFIEKIKVVGATEQGAELQQWTDWLALDLSADMTYGLEMRQMRDSKLMNPPCGLLSCC